MFEGIGFSLKDLPENARIAVGVYVVEGTGDLIVDVVDEIVTILGPENFCKALQAGISSMQKLHRYVELGIMIPAIMKEFVNDPEKRSSELQARVQAAEEDRRDEGPDRAPEG